MVNFRPLTAEPRLASLERSRKFQRVSRLGFVTAPTLLNGGQPNFARCLAVFWTGTLCTHFWGLLPLNGILLGAKLTLRPSLAFSYIGSVSARHSSSGHQANFAAWDKEGNWGTFALHLRHLYCAGRPSRWASAQILVRVLRTPCAHKNDLLKVVYFGDTAATGLRVKPPVVDYRNECQSSSLAHVFANKIGVG